MFYEITVASVDQPKLLSRLSEALVSVTAVQGRLCKLLIRVMSPGSYCRRSLGVGEGFGSRASLFLMHLPSLGAYCYPV